MARYQRKLGHEAVVIMPDGYDGYKQRAYYGVQIVGPRKRAFAHFGLLKKPLRFAFSFYSKLYFYFYAAWVARLYDVVHIHSVYPVSLLLPFKPKIVEFHGDEIRSSPNLHGKLWRFAVHFYLWLNSGKTFYVPTPDLLSELPHVVCIPIPTNIELFSRILPCVSGTALYMHNWHEKTYDRALILAQRFNLRLKIIDRAFPINNLNYVEMPRLMERYEYLIDRGAIHSLSSTAYEALALGVKVIDYNDEVITDLPSDHLPWNVAKQTITIYHEVMKR